MKVHYSLLVVASFSQTAAAFFAAPSSSAACRTMPSYLFGYLDDINEAGPVEAVDPAERFDELMANMELAFSRAQKRMGTMKIKEKESHEAIQAVEERMKQREAELTHQLESEVQNVRIAADRERQEVMERYRAREERLSFETENLTRLLETEKQKMEANNQLIRQTEATRVALDAEITQLKQRFNAESEKMSAQYVAEQEARKVEVAEAQRQIDEVQASARVLSDQAEKRITDLQEQLSIKEKQKEEAILSIQKEMSAREQALNLELETIKEEYRQREQALLSETEELNRRLESERERIRVNQEMTANLVTKRVALDTELGELRRRYNQESAQWDAKYALEQETRRLEVVKAQEEIQQLQMKAESALSHLEESTASLSEQLAAKERQKQAAILEIKDQLQAKEQGFKEIAFELGNQVTNTKIEANRREIALADEAKAREVQLQAEMEGLREMVETERKSLKINQELTNRILKQRVEIDAELGDLKRRFDQDSKKWDSKYAKQQEKRRLDVMRSQRQLQQLHDTAEQALREAWERQENLASQLAAKEKEKYEALIAIRDDMKAKEMEFKDAIGDMGRQLTKAKIDANLREMNLLAAAQEREEQLRKELDDLRALLQSEKGSQATK
ncbi:hypothetical protein MHU86_18292 [Fragilaria crotonensis]|nr:hypothetical protein MHU86_18292 [Fragilaria crotonensis]